jgi:hypothetical protein
MRRVIGRVFARIRRPQLHPVCNVLVDKRPQLLAPGDPHDNLLALLLINDLVEFALLLLELFAVAQPRRAPGVSTELQSERIEERRPLLRAAHKKALRPRS